MQCLRPGVAPGWAGAAVVARTAHARCRACAELVPRLHRDGGRRLQGCTQAQKLSEAETTAAGEWAALVRADRFDDDDKARRINAACNKGLRLMLAGDEAPLYDFRDQLSDLGETFTNEGNMPGALFIYVLYKMTENILPKEAVNLEGVYLRAFEKMFNMLEDSGWALGKEKEAGQDDAAQPAAFAAEEDASQR